MVYFILFFHSVRNDVFGEEVFLVISVFGSFHFRMTHVRCLYVLHLERSVFVMFIFISIFIACFV